MNAIKPILLIACILGGAAVILGAFGAHGLKPRLTPEQSLSFETGVRYQMFHALALLALAWLVDRHSLPAYPAWLWTAGTVLFSGSIYLLATRTLLGLEGLKALGPVTPLGGLLIISGWITLAISIARHSFK